MIPAPQTIYSDIVDEMFTNIVKTTSEFKIHSWKRKAENLKAVDIFQYKLLISILMAYENRNSDALKEARSIFPLATTPIKKAMLLKTIGNIHFHIIGGYLEAWNSYWEAYELTRDESYFECCLLVSTNFNLYDSRLEDMKSLNPETKDRVQSELEGLKVEIHKINSSNLNIEIYREILNYAYTIFFTYCNRQVTRFPNISDSNISTILFNTELNSDTVELLNDKMNDALVALLEKYDYEELLKYPILFTAEEYANLA